MPLRLSLVLLAFAHLACAHRPRAGDSFYVTGKAFRCADAAHGMIEPPAAGQPVRLVADGRVVARDVTTVDGTFVLHPDESVQISGIAYVEFGKRRLALTNDYASWMQDRIMYRVTLRTACENGAPGKNTTTEYGEPVPSGLRPATSPNPEMP